MTEETRTHLEELRAQHEAAILASSNAEQASELATEAEMRSKARRQVALQEMDDAYTAELAARKAYVAALREAGAVETASGPADPRPLLHLNRTQLDALVAAGSAEAFRENAIRDGARHANHGTAMGCPVPGCSQSQRPPEYITGTGNDGHGLTL